MVECVFLDRSCADACSLTLRELARGSQFSHEVAEWCARICGACADECEKHQRNHCQQCAKACQVCAEDCRKVALEASKEASVRPVRAGRLRPMAKPRSGRA
jgi:hypothetical protein